MSKLPVAFLDLFAILFINFLLLWILAVLLIQPAKSETINKKPHQEFMFTVTWDAKENCDVDCWAMRHENKRSLTGFNRRENDVFILHNDNTSRDYGNIEGENLEDAVETMAIERIKADTYYFSLHGYRIENEKNEITVRVEFEKLKPYKIIYSKEVILKAGDELPIIKFKIDKDGNVIDLTDDEFLVRKILR